MKILQICTDLRLGGIQRFVLDLCQELGKRHEVVLLTTWSETTDELKIDNPAFRRISLGKTHGGFSLRLMWQVCRIIWQERPDVVHTHYFTLAYSFPMAYFHLPRKTRFVHTVHSTADMEGFGPYDMFRKLTYGKKTVPVAISEQVFKSIHKIFGNINAKLIYDGTNISQAADAHAITSKNDELRLSSLTKIFVNIAHISRCKNQLMLKKVAKKLEQEGYDFKIIVLGRMDDCEYGEIIKKESCNSFIYLGPTLFPCNFLRNADYFVLCSVFEGLSISLIQALGCGCVPVCTPTGGIPSACIYHQTGILAENCTEEAFYQAMKEALELPPDTYKQYKANCLALYRERFSMEKCAVEYEKLYRSIE